MQLKSFQLLVLFAFILSGCQEVRNIKDSFDEATGNYTAPWLEGTPTTRSCADKRCRTLDSIEVSGYDLARQKKITWVSMVDTYYKKRMELFPHSLDDNGINELHAYQRYLADQMDSGKITESEWAYRIISKENEIKTRNQMLKDSAAASASAAAASSAASDAANRTGKNTTCNTTNIGTAAYPNYQTTCN